ncbi:MAG: flagellin [Oscillospiraceae bacterium]|nr:flagellin [Oscillospiraceae bacterium]
MRINNNITALNSHRQYGINNKNISKNMEKLSSGFRVNRAADDAAGLAISEKMRSQIRGLNMASKNSQDAVSLVQTAEGGMQTIQDILQRMRELAVQSASDTNQNTVDRQALQLEVNQLVEEIDQIASTTEFNKMKLLNGTGSGTPGVPGSVFGTTAGGIIQAGANYTQTMSIVIGDMSADGLGVSLLINTSNVSLPTPAPDATTTGLGIANQPSAAEAISTIDVALNKVSMARAKLGAYQNRLEYKIQNLDNQAENVSAAESRIRDADMAKMMTEFTKNNILFQASTAMLAQANALPQGVLQLLG